MLEFFLEFFELLLEVVHEESFMDCRLLAPFLVIFLKFHVGQREFLKEKGFVESWGSYINRSVDRPVIKSRKRKDGGLNGCARHEKGVND